MNEHKQKVFELFPSDIVILVAFRINRSRGFGRTTGGVRSVYDLFVLMMRTRAKQEQNKIRLLLFEMYGQWSIEICLKCISPQKI